MKWTRWIVVGVLAFSLGSGALLAGDDEASGEEGSRAEVVSQALAVIRARIEARLEEAETLRQMGRQAEALEVLRSVERIHQEGMAWVDSLLPRLGAEGAAGGGVIGLDGRPVPGIAIQPVPPVAADITPAAVATAVEDALAWLAAHQSPNGGWEAAGFGKWCNGEPAAQGPDGAGGAPYDPGVTGLALLAFLAHGHVPAGDDPHAETVARGLRYLKRIQDPEGCFGPRSTQHFVYNHAAAALAMVEAYAMTEDPQYRISAQKALDFVAMARNPYFAWRYGVRPGENDTSVTTWMVMVLSSARSVNDAAERAGQPTPLVIDESAFDGAMNWIEKMTDPDYGRVGYIQRGSSVARPQALLDRFPPEKSEAMTAAGILVRMLCGQDAATSEAIQKGASLCAALPPTWNPDDGSIDMVYWYYGTLALALVGGPRWEGWQNGILRAVVPMQRRDGDHCGYLGSWDPLGPWGPDGGRVYSTAMMALTLLPVAHRLEAAGSGVR
ncbi:MAG: prenyltransferase/squalene oxidase repeat-containing protein [Planctomycetota bacterium]|jgi:hypothetical protein